jgi:hypothetical protein
VLHCGAHRATGVHDEARRITQVGAAVRDEKKNADGDNAHYGSDERHFVAPFR